MALVPMEFQDTESTVALTMGSNVSVGAGNCTRYENLLIFNLRLEISGTIAGNGAVIATLPSGCRPSDTVSINLQAKYNNTDGMFTFKIYSNGNIQSNIGSGTLSGNIYFNNVVCI